MVLRVEGSPEGASGGGWAADDVAVSAGSAVSTVVVLVLRVVPSVLIPHIRERDSLLLTGASTGSPPVVGPPERRVLLAMLSVGAAEVAERERRGGRGPTRADAAPESL